MSAEAVETAAQAAPLTLLPAEAARLADAVRGILAASQCILSGGRQLDADQVAALRKLATRAMMVTYEADSHQRADVIDLAQERCRRRR